MEQNGTTTTHLSVCPFASWPGGTEVSSTSSGCQAEFRRLNFPLKCRAHFSGFSWKFRWFKCLGTEVSLEIDC